MDDDGERTTDADGGETSAPGDAFEAKPPDEEVAEIEAERERRLAAENRPENAEVDNTGDNMPEVAKEADSGEGIAGTSDPGKAFRENPPSEEEVAEIQAERERRLAAGNRPDNAEVDNTGDNLPEVARSENQD